TLDILYGEDININGLLDLNENDGDQSYPIDNGDGKLDRGWHPYLTAYSYEKNVSGSGEERININSANQETLQNTFGEDLSQTEINSIISVREEEEFTSVGELLDKSAGGQRVSISRDKLKNIIDRITTSDEEALQGKVNLNTASKEVLMILLGEENQELIERIIEYRESGEGPFDDLGEVLDIDGITDAQFQSICEFACTKSSVFSVRSAGYLERSKAYKEIYAVVDRGVDPPEIRYWKVLR
ncbi:MAG: helix-hairpin-helix domain-containing protein, partial [Candidatus Hinthialibacter sp.]